VNVRGEYRSRGTTGGSEPKFGAETARRIERALQESTLKKGKEKKKPDSSGGCGGARSRSGEG